MIRWVHLDTAKAPGGGELRLMQRGAEFSIMAGAIELMNSRLSGSEKALATLACERIRGRRAPRFLVGGLGMGFTLRAALSELPPEARVEVVELVPEVVAWARGPLAHIFEGSLEDRRVTVVEADVGAVIRAGRAAYDAIVLDVDNGPAGLSRGANDSLYSAGGLAAAKRALRPEGVLGVWSGGPDAKFTQRLRHAGFATEEIAVRATGGRRGARHVVWMATAPP